MKKRTLVRLLTYSAAAFAVIAGFAVKYANEAKAYRRAELYGGYMAMSELADAAEGMSRAFSASVYAYSPEILASLSNSIWQNSAGAVEALSRLPLYEAQMENTRSFIARAGDYAAYISRAAVSGGLQASEREAMREMASAAASLSDSLRRIEGDVYAGNVMFSGAVFTNNGAVFRFGDLEDAGEYPSPEYDGLLSETYVNRTACALEGAKPCSQDEAAALAAKALGCDVQALEYDGQSNGRVPCHMFRCGEDEAYLSCDGGLLLTLRRAQSALPQEETQSEDGAVATVQQASDYDARQMLAAAADALADLGYANMTPVESTQGSDGVSAKFVYEENGVRCYPDEIRISYSPHERITSLNAASYMANHRVRGVSAQQAEYAREKDALPAELSAEYMGCAVIDNGYGGEFVCREYQAQIEDGKTLHMFCDADTGAQRKIEIEG